MRKPRARASRVSLIPIKFSHSGPVTLDVKPKSCQKKLNFLDVFACLVMEKQLLPADLKTKFNGNCNFLAIPPSSPSSDVVNYEQLLMCPFYQSLASAAPVLEINFFPLTQENQIAQIT